MADYPTGHEVNTTQTNMSPEMEAKYLWLMDQAVAFGKEQHGGQGPITPQALAGFNPQQVKALQMAQSGIGAYEPMMNKAEAATDNMVNTQFDPSTYKNYLDPYQDYVTQGISDQYDKAMNQANMGAASKGAYGGSGTGIMNAELLGGKSQAIGQSLSQGYGNAMNMARGDFENQMTRYGAGAQQYGNMAGQTQQMGQQDVASLMGAGSVMQQNTQQGLDSNYQAYLQNRQDPYQRFGFMSDIFRGVPSGQMTTTMGTAPVTNPLSQALGAGIFGAGISSGYANS
tara:strand:+ start:338 stop:1192 length:855 start_codon:yes stop_codon:yes gene_type:complete